MNNLIEVTLFGSGIAFGILVVLFFISLIISDISKDGTIAFVATLIFLGLNYFWGAVPTNNLFTWENVGIYLLIGFIYSLIRTYFKRREFNRIEEMLKQPSRDRLYFNIKDHVFRWWFLWPVSLFVWILSDILKDVYDFVYECVSSVYTTILGESKYKEIEKH